MFESLLCTKNLFSILRIFSPFPQHAFLGLCVFMGGVAIPLIVDEVSSCGTGIPWIKTELVKLLQLGTRF